MKNAILLMFVFAAHSLSAQYPVGSKHYGGSNTEVMGRGIFVGNSFYQSASSGSSDYDVLSNGGDYDGWFIKTNIAGDTVLTRVYGGSGYDLLEDVIATDESSIMFTGTTSSTDGYFSTLSNYGGNDAFILALDTNAGFVYQKNLGGTLYDDLRRIIRTNDGGYLLTGMSSSSNNDLSNNYGNDDGWVIRLSSTLSTVWSYNYGGSDLDFLTDALLLPDNTFIVAGNTDSQDQDCVGNKGSRDLWVMHLSSTGTVLWSKTFGSSQFDIFNGLLACSDGNFIAYGSVSASDGDVGTISGLGDGWMVKFDSSGDTLWTQTVGWGAYDFIHSVSEVSGDRYLTFMASSEIPVSGHFGQYDGTLSLVSQGNVQYINHFGGTSIDCLADGLSGQMFYNEANSSLFISTLSMSNDGDLPQNYGNYDLWHYGTTLSVSGINNDESKLQSTLYPNPADEKTTLQISSFTELARVQIFNIEGQLVLTYETNSEESTLDVSSLESGIYSVFVSTSTSNQTLKLTVF